MARAMADYTFGSEVRRICGFAEGLTLVVLLSHRVERGTNRGSICQRAVIGSRLMRACGPTEDLTPVVLLSARICSTYERAVIGRGFWHVCEYRLTAAKLYPQKARYFCDTSLE